VPVIIRGVAEAERRGGDAIVDGEYAVEALEILPL